MKNGFMSRSCIHKYGLVWLLLLSVSRVFSAAPGTDISLFKIIYGEQGVELKYDKALIQREGYDNQPFFSEDSQFVYFTSEQQGNTDIWKVNIESAKQHRITVTPESEYSPTPISFRGRNQGEPLSSVIAFEGKQTLRLIRNGIHSELLSSDLEPIGYHTWINTKQLAIFQLAEPHKLMLLNIDADTSSDDVSYSLLAQDIGRCMVSKNNDDEFFFVQNEKGQKQLRRYSIKSGKSTFLTNLLKDKEDYAWHISTGFVHSDGESIFQLNNQQLKSKRSWQPVKIEQSPVLKNISRLAISPNSQWLAVVHNDFREE